MALATEVESEPASPDAGPSSNSLDAQILCRSARICVTGPAAAPSRARRRAFGSFRLFFTRLCWLSSDAKDAAPSPRFVFRFRRSAMLRVLSKLPNLSLVDDIWHLADRFKIRVH